MITALLTVPALSPADIAGGPWCWRSPPCPPFGQGALGVPALPVTETGMSMVTSSAHPVLGVRRQKTSCCYGTRRKDSHMWKTRHPTWNQFNTKWFPGAHQWPRAFHLHTIKPTALWQTALLHCMFQRSWKASDTFFFLMTSTIVIYFLLLHRHSTISLFLRYLIKSSTMFGLWVLPFLPLWTEKGKENKTEIQPDGKKMNFSFIHQPTMYWGLFQGADLQAWTGEVKAGRWGPRTAQELDGQRDANRDWKLKGQF